MCLPVKPYKVEKAWEHAGLKCVVVLNREQGHRCGYVRIMPDHPSHCEPYNDVDVHVHGGLTYGRLDVEHGYWLGWDCAHFGDSYVNPDVPTDYKWESEESRESYEYSYKTRNLAPIREGEFAHYWTFEEVVAETERLAQQLYELSLKGEKRNEQTDKTA